MNDAEKCVKSSQKPRNVVSEKHKSPAAPLYFVQDDKKRGESSNENTFGGRYNNKRCSVSVTHTPNVTAVHCGCECVVNSRFIGRYI